MKQMICAVRDAKAEAFLPPFFQPTKAAAIRVFANAINEPGGDFNRYAGDFALYWLGDIDDQNGKLIPQPQPVELTTGFDVKREPEKENFPLLDWADQVERDGKTYVKVKEIEANAK